MADKVGIVDRLVDTLHDSWGEEVKSKYLDFRGKVSIVTGYDVVMTQAAACSLDKLMHESADVRRRAWAIKWLDRMIAGVNTCNQLVISRSDYITSSVGLAFVRT